MTRFVAVRVRDFARAVAFYRDVIGLEVRAAGESEVRFEGDAITLFVEALPAADAASDEATAGTRGRYAGKTFFEFEVDDFAKAREALLGAGCRESSSGIACGAASDGASTDGSMNPDADASRGVTVDAGDGGSSEAGTAADSGP